MSEKATNNLLRALQVEYRKEMNDITDHMATGGCTSFEDYQHCVGVIKGLAHAERALLDLNDRAERE
ncbi:MAG: hypothetical protein ACYSW8_16315 [Planctomycetota bacterium]|jgi:hypothetical protein